MSNHIEWDRRFFKRDHGLCNFCPPQSLQLSPSRGASSPGMSPWTPSTPTPTADRLMVQDPLPQVEPSHPSFARSKEGLALAHLQGTSAHKPRFCGGKWADLLRACGALGPGCLCCGKAWGEVGVAVGAHAVMEEGGADVVIVAPTCSSCNVAEATFR
jgi:hypothetical protein